MESFIPLGGFQLPFQKRLSRLYNDTKKSTDFVKEPIQNEEDPEMKALHRKLRIQKDRLVSWGLEWSDPNQSIEIDESLSKAGLSEVVGSIMSTIKDILAEAEPLWQSSKRLVPSIQPSGGRDRKAPLVQWDKGRFEDLVRDLTVSIDTLYDLSRTRSSSGFVHRSSKTPFKSSAAVEEFRPFESTRMQTPQQIDPQTLTHLRPKQNDGKAPTREVVFMSKIAYSELTHGTTREPWAPLLLEYAEFDAIYAMTGIMPPMARFEKLSAGLQQDPQRSPGTWTGLPRLLGYFEDLENSRLGLVYRFPPSFNAVSFERLTQNPFYNLPTMRDLLNRPASEPPLEAKFRLGKNLANTVFDMHARGITHGNLIDGNICFCDAVTTQASTRNGEVDIRRPLVSSFDVFPDDNPVSSYTLSRHPLDPRTVLTSPLAKNPDQRVLDLYSLAMVLLSIGLWTNLETLVPDGATFVPESLLDQLAVRCGTLYMKAVQACWGAVDDQLAERASGEDLLSTVQVKASRYLEACCILDGVSGFEERLGQEVEQPSASAPSKSYSEKISTKISKDMKDFKDSKASKYPDEKKQPAVLPRSAPGNDVDNYEADFDAEGLLTPLSVSLLPLLTKSQEAVSTKMGRSEAKLRLYPNVPLPPDAVDKWNVILMPQINHALRHFYRKHPESVEISLESVGPSPQKTKPTVLVVCTSVGKVRAILKKRLGDLFDGTTGFGLKVCRGQVARSRVRRSMARRSAAKEGGDDEIEPINPEYQRQPKNGASIGAWIGDRHLPPVSLGGLILVDNKPYGMTVHHMLDDPEQELEQKDTMRSSAIPGRDWYADSAEESSVDDDFAYEFSDNESEAYSDSDITSDYEDDEDEEEDDEYEPGDIMGIEPDCGDGYIVTQPALDDVEEGFYPDPETEDDDHLDTYRLGNVYASSGIRRKQAHGLVHEVDWALLEFDGDRLPSDNSVLSQEPKSMHRPRTVAPSSSLPGMEVQCMARTSGLQFGQILPALTSVKIYGRVSPSHTYQVTSMTSRHVGQHGSKVPLGVPGDSGAWVIGRDHGEVCGHVLAWSQRKRVAYICPMEVLLLDIAETLEASEIRLPGGEPAVTMGQVEEDCYSEGDPNGKRVEGADGYEEIEDEDDDEPPALAKTSPASRSISSHRHGHVSSHSTGTHGTSTPIRLETSSQLVGLSGLLEEMNMSGSMRIGVSG